ncbi:MAG: transcription antitermination factor NusB [Patescibacteria group bacterium]
MNRHLSRMVSMQAIYEWNFRPDSNLEEILQRSIAEFADDIDKEFVKSEILGVSKHRDALDKEIEECAPEWPIEQISVIDKSILEIAIYELLHTDDIPPKVSINEAVELAKQFGSNNSGKFINGVLGTIYTNHKEQVEKKETKNE